MEPIAHVALFVAIFMGVLVILSASWVFVKKGAIGVGGLLFSFLGVLLISLSLWQYLEISVSSKGISAKLKQFEKALASLTREATDARKQTEAEIIGIRQDTKKLEDETQSLKRLIAETEAGLLVAPPSEPVVLPELIVPGVRGITYADYAHQLQQVRDGFLRNNFSGYPDLLTSVRRLLDGRCPEGNPVPLTILNEKYLGNTSQPVMTHDMTRIQNAYVAAWRDKNMDSAIQDFNSIAPRCQN